MEQKDRIEQVRATFNTIRSKIYNFQVNSNLNEVVMTVSHARQLSEEIRNTIIRNNESVHIEECEKIATELDTLSVETTEKFSL
jgi:putative heme iron utilization protein